MALTALEAIATTFRIAPGEEMQDEAGVHVRRRVFTDRVVSSEPRLDGTDVVTLDLDFNPADGTGRLAGTLELTLSNGDGSWQGELEGRFEGGLVRASGLARGTGKLASAVLHIDFRQIPEHPGAPPCDTPLAFFQMTGTMLSGT